MHVYWPEAQRLDVNVYNAKNSGAILIISQGGFVVLPHIAARVLVRATKSGEYKKDEIMQKLLDPFQNLV